MFRPEFALPGMKVSVNHSAKKLIPDSVGVRRSPLNPAGFDRIMWGSVTSSHGRKSKSFFFPFFFLLRRIGIRRCRIHFFGTRSPTLDPSGHPDCFRIMPSTSEGSEPHCQRRLLIYGLSTRDRTLPGPHLHHRRPPLLNRHYAASPTSHSIPPTSSRLRHLRPPLVDPELVDGDVNI